MKKRQIRKENKQRMKGIINSLKEFNAYDLKFVQTFALSIGHFKIKEFPEWEFGIWLTHNSDTFDIFGENIYMIDKFKPSRCTLSFESIDTKDFQSELKLILKNTDKEWNEYLENAKNAKQLEIKTREENFKIYQSIKNAIKELNKEYSIEDNVELKINEYNRCYPRYRIELYCVDKILNNKEVLNKYLSNSYNIISNKKYFSKDIKFGLDEYLFENISLYSPEEYEYNKSIYSSWTETFDEYKNNLLIGN